MEVRDYNDEFLSSTLFFMCPSLHLAKFYNTANNLSQEEGVGKNTFILLEPRSSLFGNQTKNKTILH